MTPVLTAKKIWWGKDALIKFGQQNCLLSKQKSLEYYNECFLALKWGVDELEKYLEQNQNFIIGK